MKTTHVYVDGFNLYYGCLRGTSHRWLDLAEFCRLMLPNNDLQCIKYFTARVGSRPNDPSKPERQRLYLRALGTLPLVEVHFGHHLTHKVAMPLANPPATGSRYALVLRTEEKGSDVNLATHLISDAYENRMDVAVLVTNDSDLLAPVQLVSERLGKEVGVLNPQRHPAKALRRASSFFKQVRPGVLAASQFPKEMQDVNGTFRKPATW